MFYSHQLLARKTPMGQIWMAATLHAKINRRKLDKLNIIKICEEILNPTVPMALRLSGILMGGVVIVYERKVKLLYDDVNRLLVEINEAWKVKGVQDPTALPKGKVKAKFDAVTLPENQNTDVGETEQSLNFSNTDEFQRTEYFAMRLDDIGEPFFTNNMEENFHQADPADITTKEYYNPYQANTDFGNHFERFDIDGEEDTQVNFTTTVHTEIPTLVPSPPLRDELPKSDEIPDHCAEQGYQQSDVHFQAEKPLQDKQLGPAKRRGKRPTSYIMDYDQTIIPGQVFQSWLKSASDVVRRKRRRLPTGGLPNLKLSYRMELPPLVLLFGLFTTGNQEIYYPAPILELWTRSTQPPHDTPSGRTSPPQPPEPSSSSPPNGINYQSSMGNIFEDINGGYDSHSIERLRRNLDSDVVQIESVVGLKTTSGVDPGKRAQSNVVTPGNSGDDVRSIPSTGSGNSLPSFTSHVSSGRLNKKRPYSLLGQDGIGLEPVTEENLLYPQELNFELAKQDGSRKSPEHEPLVETGPTQTQKPAKDHPVDKITDALRMHWKTHFDTPGVLPTESLNNLTSGISRKKAAQLFYQTCVLASLDFLRVKQNVPYGDILLSRGAKM
ncbi:unnamed protein product [Rhodiola kirilowii]